MIRFALPFVFAILVYPPLARAIEVESGLSSMLKAKTSTDLARRLEREHRLQREKLVCEAQLRGTRIPSACFKVLDLASASESRSAKENDAEWLIDICISRARSAQDWTELESAQKSGTLPLKCLRIVESRIGDLQYAAQSERPNELFKRSFGNRTK